MLNHRITQSLLFAGLCGVLAAAVAPRTGAAAEPASRPATSPAAGPATGPSVDTSDALLLHIPGIAGETDIDHAMLDGIRDAGFKGKFQLYDWTGEKKGINALVNREHNNKEAQKIADLIVARAKASPKGPLVISGHSAGTGLAIFALERLPKDVMIDSLLLLSPALSPTYDLSTALTHVRGRVYCFSSTMDVFVLGLGTKLFGTIDGHKGESAGKVGFTPPEKPVDPKQYEKVSACPYERAWVRFGNIGDHMSVMSQSFAKYVLAPLIFSNLPGAGEPMAHPVTPVGPIELPKLRPSN